MRFRPTLATAFALACSSPEGPRGAASSIVAPPPSESAAPTALSLEPTWAPSAGGGATYFEIYGRHFVRLDASGVAQIVSTPPYLRNLIRGADNQVYARKDGAVFRLNGLEATLHAELEGGSRIKDYAIGPTGEVAAVTDDALLLGGPGKKTEVIPRATIGCSEALYRVGISGDEIVVASFHSAFVRVRGAWQRIPSPVRFDMFDEISRFDGRAVVIHSHESVRDVSFVGADGSLEPTGVGARHAASLSDEGATAEALVDMFTRVIRRDHGGKTTSWDLGPSPARGFDGDTVSVVQVDARARVWAAAMRAGFGVLVGDEPPRIVPTGAVPVLSGQINAMVTVGEGGSLPAVGPLHYGAAKGRLVDAGAPVAHEPVWLCANPADAYERIPCAKSKVRYRTVTDDDGRFVFDRIPLGDYGYMTPDHLLLMFASIPNEGEVVDLGQSDLKGARRSH